MLFSEIDCVLQDLYKTQKGNLVAKGKNFNLKYGGAYIKQYGSKDN
jgi:hypothetical protein